MAPAWRAAPLPKAHCAAAAAIEATATEPWTEAQLLQELDAPAGRLFGLYAGETLCGAAVFQLAADEASLESVTIAPEQRRRPRPADPCPGRPEGRGGHPVLFGGAGPQRPGPGPVCGPGL